MIEHLDNILNDINEIKKANKYNLNNVDINFLKKFLIKFIN